MMKDESILKDLSRRVQANASAPLAQPFGIGTYVPLPNLPSHFASPHQPPEDNEGLIQRNGVLEQADF